MSINDSPDAVNSKAPRRWPGRGARVAAYLAMALMWGAAALLAGEVWTRVAERRMDPAIAALKTAMHSRALEERKKLCARFGIPEPPEMGADIASRVAFADLDVDARQAYARERNETVFVCDATGGVLESYAYCDLPAIRSVSEKIVAEGNLLRALAPLEDLPPTPYPPYEEQAKDLARALSEVANSGFQFREFELPIPGGGRDVAQFTVQLLRSDGLIAVYIRPSMWKRVWQEFRPGVHLREAEDTSINRFGFRDGEVTVPRPEGVIRIVCVGGSTTAEGPTNDLTYPKLLERVLRERHATDRIEVINAGIYASKSMDEAERVPQYLALQPTLLLHYNAVNDIAHSIPDWIAPASTWGVPVYLLKVLASQSRLVHEHANAWLRPSDARLRRGYDEDVFSNLRLMVEDARQAGVEVAFASYTYPDYEHLPAVERAWFDEVISGMDLGQVLSMESYIHLVREYNARLRPFCEEAGAAYLPLAEDFRHGASIYTDICHMYPEGMLLKAERMADLLAPYVREQLAAAP